MRLNPFKHDEAEATAPPTAETCVHGVRIPHWDALDDMGNLDRADYFTCESCGQRFTRAENDALASPAEVIQGIQREAA